MDISERMRNSIALLDKYGPAGWRDRIDLDRLNMGDPYRCVGGQVFAIETRQAEPYVSEPGWMYPGYGVLVDLRVARGISYHDWVSDYAFGASTAEELAWREELARPAVI